MKSDLNFPFRWSAWCGGGEPSEGSGAKTPCAEKAQGVLHLEDAAASYEAAHELHVGDLGKPVH